MVPTVEWAEYILDKKGEEALQELWEILLKLCYIDEDNDVVKTLGGAPRPKGSPR